MSHDRQVKKVAEVVHAEKMYKEITGPESGGIMMDAKPVFEKILAGKMTLAEVEAWVENVAPAYERPPLKEMLGKVSEQELDRLVDRYSDWEIRVAQLARYMTRYAKQADELADRDPERAILLAQVNLTLSNLLDHPMNGPSRAFHLGYILLKTKHYFDAAEALTKAVTGLQQTGADPQMEIMALSYLSDSLYEDKQFDHAIIWAEELLNRARQLNLRGQVALALRDKGQALANLGRKEEALECLRRALEVRKSLSSEEVGQQSEISIEAFLDAYAQATRRFGRFEDAITTFRELAERQKQAEDLPLQARAVSDIGYTYWQASELDRAIQYLQEAIHLATEDASVESLRDAARWQMQIDLLRGRVSRDNLPFESIYSSRIEDSDTAYLQDVKAQQLLVEEQYHEAVSVALPVLEWAQRSKDTHLEISVHSTLGSCYAKSDQMARSVDEFQKGIQLADGTRNDSSSIGLRYNLAKTYIMQGKNQESADVLLSGIVYSLVLLDNTETSEFRQQIIAGSLGLYELYALLTSATRNHKHLVAVTELARARNLYGWMRADQYLESSTISADIESRARDALKKLRAAEVELEVRHLTSQITISSITLLKQHRERVQAEITTLFKQAGLPTLAWDQASDYDFFAATDELLEVLLQPGLAIICLFSVPEGICPVVLHCQGKEIISIGQFISWDRAERQEALAGWTGNKNFRQGRGTLSISERDTSRIGASAAAGLDRFLSIFREHVIGALVEILSQIQAQRLVVIPHRELALVPYWELMDQCPSIQSVTLAPSLNVLRLCLMRQRPTRGQTVLVGDLTHSLAQAVQEVEYVKQVRKDSAINEPKSIDEFRHISQGCSLAHIAAHGLFNTENPYYSGFLAAKQESAEGIFAQYASLPSFQLSGNAGMDSIRLMTIAECMAELSLNTCRLAVLSTCESGIARQHGGGEMTGLPNSLLVAGAKSVIASLWRVHDTATALLMHYFYEAWEGGVGKESSPPRALAVARQKLRAAGREEIIHILGPMVSIPGGNTPFAQPIYTDAFHCFGSW